MPPPNLANGVPPKAFLAFVLATLGSLTNLHAEPGSVDPRLHFFETRIRPVLIERCYSCHSEQASEQNQLHGGLLLDSRNGLIDGGDSGPAILPGDPDSSPLLAALRYESFEMPPEGPLPEQTIRDFEKWILDGAFDPREGEASTNKKLAIDWQAARLHWAYQPLEKNKGGSVDTWLATGNPSHDFLPAPRATPDTLLRRLTIDLTGLPPTPEQILSFRENPSPQNYSRIVDSLLASPEFGIRWGRHWLDLARFAESVTLRGLVQHYAWRYRDYVIDAFNADIPYDRFLTEQIAGDLLPYDSIDLAQRQHIATTFLALGNLNLEDQDKEKLRMDAVDEQLNVLGSAILAQTIGCARCHDHKFDPIPTRDYYALAGIFYNTRTLDHANVSSWIDRPLPIDDSQAESIAAYEKRTAELKDQLDRIRKQLTPANRSDKNVAPELLNGIIVDNRQAKLVGEWTSSEHSPHFVGPEYLHDDARDFGEKSAIFPVQVPETGLYEVRISYSPGTNRSHSVHVSVQDFLDTHPRLIDQRQKPPIEDLFVSLGSFQFVTGMPGAITISNAGGSGHTIIDSVQLLRITPTQNEAVRPEERLPSRKATSDIAELSAQQRSQLQQKLVSAQEALDNWTAQPPNKPLYMGVYEEKETVDLAIQIRGNVHHRGEIAPRGFLQIVPIDEPRRLPQNQSGRVELAGWLTHPENPLPARVLANRIWAWLCGAGIVRSVDNFGLTGQPPTHPDLLEYLASRLVQSGWSIKAVIREIVLSDVYQRSSMIDHEIAAKDPENRLWLRANPKPLTAEAMLDSILLASGQIDRRMGGKTIPDRLAADYDFDPTSNRRAIYWPLLRNALPEMMTVFDGADPSVTTGQRWNSTVAPQALFLLNHPWLLQHSEAIARQLLTIPANDDRGRIFHLFQSLLGRSPHDAEKAAILDYLKVRHASAEVVWSEIVQSLLATVDFRYVD